MSDRTWWQKPQLRRDEEFEQHRAVTWLELFFDLVFVVVIARLAHSFSEDLTFHGLLNFLVMFLPVWWVWNAATYYTERFESEGIENRFFTFLKMITVAGMAIYSHHGLEESYIGFSISYLLARMINIFMWLRAAYHVHEFRPVAYRFAAGFIIVVLSIVLSYFIDFNYHIYLWSFAVFTDIITPYFTMKQQAKLPKLSTSKFPERFGLLTIIVLGEAVVGVINGLSELHHLDFQLILSGILGLFITFSMWWIYFDFIARRAAKATITTALIWVYLHIFLMTAITITAVALTSAFKEIQREQLGTSTQSILLFCLSFYLLISAVLEKTLARKDDEPTHRHWSPLLKVFSSVMLFTGHFIFQFNTIQSFIWIILFLGINQLYGALVWFKDIHKFKKET